MLLVQERGVDVEGNTRVGKFEFNRFDIHSKDVRDIVVGEVGVLVGELTQFPFFLL